MVSEGRAQAMRNAVDGWKEVVMEEEEEDDREERQKITSSWG